MHSLARLLIFLLGAALLAGPAAAGSLADAPDCAALAKADRARAGKLAEQHYLYDCCEDTVANCLAAARPCPLAVRLAGDLCRRVAAGETDEQIDAAMKLRARSMMPVCPRPLPRQVP